MYRYHFSPNEVGLNSIRIWIQLQLKPDPLCNWISHSVPNPQQNFFSFQLKNEKNVQKEQSPPPFFSYSWVRIPIMCPDPQGHWIRIPIHYLYGPVGRFTACIPLWRTFGQIESWVIAKSPDLKILTLLLPGLWIRIRIGSVFNVLCGSGFGIRIWIYEQAKWRTNALFLNFLNMFIAKR
jgi:hypothetical protein